MWSMHTMNYFAAIKINEVLTHTIMWTNLENMLSERSQIQNVSYEPAYINV